MTYMDEAQVELVTVEYFREMGYAYVHGPDIAPDGEAPEREDYRQVMLAGRLREALVRIKREIPVLARRSFPSAGAPPCNWPYDNLAIGRTERLRSADA